MALDKFGLASPFPILLNNCDIALNQESSIQTSDTMADANKSKPRTNRFNKNIKSRKGKNSQLDKRNKVNDAEMLARATSKLQETVKEVDEEDSSSEKDSKKNKNSQKETAKEETNGKLYSNFNTCNASADFYSRQETQISDQQFTHGSAFLYFEGTSAILPDFEGEHKQRCCEHGIALEKL